jgi:ArsR family transcriptional regulator
MAAVPVALLAPARTRGCCVQVAPPLPVAQAEDLAGLFKALADPTRVQMVHMLKAASEPICVCDFTAAFDLGQPTVSHHLARLREAGLISSFKRGVWTFHSLRPNLSAAYEAVLALIP